MKGATSPRSTSTKRAGRRLIAIGLTLLVTFALATPVFATGGGGAEQFCGDHWVKTSPDGTVDEVGGFASESDWPDIEVDLNEAGTMASWTSDPAADSVHVKSADEFLHFPGGTSGDITGKVKTTGKGGGYHQISHIAFCYPEPTPETGTLSVTKDVVGEYDGETEFAFAGTCTLPHLVAHETFTLADGETWSFGEPIPEYLDGSDCELKETGTNGADTVAYSLNGSPLTADGDGKVHFELSSTEDLVVTVTNTFRALEAEIDISPIFECWEEDPESEGYIAYFGWENRSTLDGEPYTVSREEAGFDVTPWAYEPFFPDEFEYPFVIDGRPGRTPFDQDAPIEITGWDGSNIVFRLDGRTATASTAGKQCPVPPEPEIELKPVFECWHPDGTGDYTAYFGWENRSTIGDEPYTEPISREDAGFAVTPTSYETLFPLVFDYPTDGPRPGRTPYFPDAAITIPDWDGSNIVFRLDGRTATAGLSGPRCDIPDIVPEKAWYEDADDEDYAALFRWNGEDWSRVGEGDPFVIPDGFDLWIEHGATSYTVSETLPSGWQEIDCPEDAPEPNGTGTFPYTEPDNYELKLLRLDDFVEYDYAHPVCNAPSEEPPMSRLTVTKDAVNYGGSDTFPFAGTCTYEGAEAATPISFALADNGTWTTGWVETGAVCELHETNSRGASSVAYRLDGVTPTLQPDGDVRVEMFQARDYALLVTNTFTSTPPPPPPPPPSNPDIDLVKEAAITPDLDGLKYVEFDEDEPLPTITYNYTVTNTGETSLSDLTLIDTPLGAVTLQATSLAPGASTTGIALHALTPAEIEAGQVFNEATVTGTAPNGTRVTDEDDDTVFVLEVLPEEIVREPAIELEKEALIEPDDNGDKVVEWTDGEDAPTVTYRYTITNTGETALTGLVLVDDPLGTIELPADGLAVGAVLVVTFDHDVLAAEAETGKIVNVATVTASSPDGDEVTATATETVLLVEVLPIAIEPGEILPATGAALGALAIIGGLALMLGAGTLVYDRRRR